MIDSALSRFEVLTFDCYGTLIDWERGLLNAISSWLPAGGQRPTDEELLVAYADCEATEERERPGHPYPQILEGAGRALAARLGIALDHAKAAEFGQSVRHWPAFADSKEALRLLKQRYKLVVLSNIDGKSFAHSQEKLGCKFDAIVTAEEVGHYKPDVRMFEAVFSRIAGMGFERDQILHVAQSLYHDHVPAKQLGMRTVHIDRRAGKQGTGATPPPAVPVKPDWTFETLIAFARAAG